MRIARRLAGFSLALIGLFLTGGGIYLIVLGGSFYYALAGLGCLLASVLIFKRQTLGIHVYALVLLGTSAWAFVEVGSDFWQLLPRVAGPLVVMALVLLSYRKQSLSRAVLLSAGGSAAMAFALLLGTGLKDTRWQVNDGRARASQLPEKDEGGSDDWIAFGRTGSGTRYAPADQITPANVQSLKLAWTYRTGDSRANRPAVKGFINFEVTPIKVGDTLYLCTPHNIVIALDAETGKPRWRFDPKVDDTDVLTRDCRGVSFHQAAGPETDCSKRIVTATIDARLIAIDARTGRRCARFGRNGEVSLRDGMGEVRPGTYLVTSPPVVVGDVVAVGGFVRDNVSTSEPSGVIRGYNIFTGELVWAWDSGRSPSVGPLKPGQAYTRGSPNAWGILSGDPDLGMIYAPMGNATPDFVGMHRNPDMERYASSIVAIDARTGAVRWHFQTTHHDIWDYDVPAQPVLIDYRTSHGVVPALAAPTKRGEIFILDRRTGAPLVPVQERTAPRGDIPRERYAATQPYSTFPSLAPAPLREKDMWGISPIDQLWCRIRFRALDYKGNFTPPSVRGALVYPGNLGAISWGSVSVDEGRRILVANSQYMPLQVRLVPRATVDGTDPSGELNLHTGMNPQKGTPFGAILSPFLSPLGIPCIAPPWGKLTAIDIDARKILWQRPLGTSADTAPFGIGVPGVFNTGPSVVTRSGLIFIAATMDQYLRAFDIGTGEELWRGRLPAGGQAGAMTYMAPKSGRQMVVIAAGGHEVLGSKTGDYVIAFALPAHR